VRRSYRRMNKRRATATTSLINIEEEEEEEEEKKNENENEDLLLEEEEEEALLYLSSPFSLNYNYTTPPPSPTASIMMNNNYSNSISECNSPTYQQQQQQQQQQHHHHQQQHRRGSGSGNQFQSQQGGSSASASVAVADNFSKALMNLSFNDRSKIEEEIHGVTCMAPDETPYLIQQSLYQLVIELSHIPIENKLAYNMVIKENSNSNNSISNEFRLRFLRSELFDIKKAAYRLVKYLDLILDIYGKEVLMRDNRHPMLDDFNKEEMAFLRGGDYQLLPYRVSLYIVIM
jgi:hypothetical protein